MKNLKTFKALSAAAVASSILLANAGPAFAEEMIPQESIMETTSVSKMLLTFDANGGDINSVPKAQSAQTETILTINPTTPKRNGYKFAGWSENPLANPAETLVHGGESYILNKTTTLFAIWMDDAEDADEVEVDEDTQEEAQQEVQPVTPQQTQQAVAEAVSFQLMLDTHGGSMSIHSVTSDENGNVVLPEEKPVKDGFNFIGWAEDPESGEVKHQPGETYTINNDMKLYAVWQQAVPEIHVNLLFDANGGFGGPTSIATNADGTVTIPTLIPAKNGFKFMGWSTDAKATKAMYGVNQTLTLNSDLKLYAVWEADSKVNTGVENNMMMYLGLGGIAALAAGVLATLKRKHN